MGKNFNVVLPFADLCLGTLLRRSPVRFAQATGPSIPDVQPAGASEAPGMNPMPGFAPDAILGLRQSD
jgi:hypothetical protein